MICGLKVDIIVLVGTELGGDVVHSSMYQHLWTNAPKVSVHNARRCSIKDCFLHKSIW